MPLTDKVAVVVLVLSGIDSGRPRKCFRILFSVVPHIGRCKEVGSQWKRYLTCEKVVLLNLKVNMKSPQKQFHFLMVVVGTFSSPNRLNQSPRSSHSILLPEDLGAAHNIRTMGLEKGKCVFAWLVSPRFCVGYILLNHSKAFRLMLK